MDNLETPYDEEAEFIECTVCEKSIRGHDLYKIHLATPGHIKKEDALVAVGRAVRKHNVPRFEDIIQYLDYMKLDEPIIGLDYLEEEPSNDPQAGPKYTCGLCHQTADLSEMVRHVIGRKHRQKYVETKRPDLVTWDKQSIISQGGKIIRARAEIIERQDGRGFPVLMVKKRTEDKFNFSRVPPRQKPNRDQNISQHFTQQETSHIPPLMDFQTEYIRRGKSGPGQPNTPPFNPDRPYMPNQGSSLEDDFSHDHMKGGGVQMSGYRTTDVHGQNYPEQDSYPEYKDNYMEGNQRRDVLAPGGVSSYDSRVEMPRGNAQHEEYYPEEPPQYKSTYPERDMLKEFYSEEIRRGQVRSVEYQPSKPGYPEGDSHRWSLDRDSDRHDGINRAGRQGSSEPDAQRRSFPTSMSAQPRNFTISIRDYGHKALEPLQLQEAAGLPGPSRPGPNTQKQVEVTRSLSDIPEPFRRFLSGSANGEGNGKRKRKSRFSDATAEEVETTKEMFSGEYGPPKPKFCGFPRQLGESLRPEFHGRQNSDFYAESQGPHYSESYQSGSSESTGVFDVLKSVAIENAEEADFLKSKLCDLLKEFKAKKSDKHVQNSHSRSVILKDYNNMKPDSEPSPSRHQHQFQSQNQFQNHNQFQNQHQHQHQNQTVLREDFDFRRTENLSFQENNRERGWKQNERVPDKQLQEYHLPPRGESRNLNLNLNRNRFEGFDQREISVTPRMTHADGPPNYPERFQEPMYPRDYRSSAGEFLNSRSPVPPVHTERGTRMDRGTRYSSSLDKITSTLLELVSRK